MMPALAFRLCTRSLAPCLDSVLATEEKPITSPTTSRSGSSGSKEESDMSSSEIARRLGTYSYTIRRWTSGRARPNTQHLMGLLDLAFGTLPPFVTEETRSYRGSTETRVWFNDNEFTHAPVTDPPNPLGLSRRMRGTFADAELEAKEGLYETGSVATVRIRLNRYSNRETQVIIPILRNLHGATDGVDFAGVPDHLIFLPGQTEHSFRVRAINEDIDDDREYLTFSFGTLLGLVYAGDKATTRVDLVDDDDPPVQVFFEQANYEVTNIQQDGNTEYARLNVKVKLSAAPERFIDVGIVPESIQGGGHIHFEYSAYIPRGPHDGAHFYADDTEFTLQIYISARGGFDPNQTYQLRFDGMSYRMSVGSPATATITINPNP